ncbi:MAG: DNA methylase N-4 [Ralstonia sp.]|uniref:site-specific DNA-methyltransferase n=1 Tax=Ralstonia sp. TaxID=54061 RepID=UPI002579ECA5|nr:DNA methyltransferase [Ralstonia sp.]MBA4233789.1 DNA methylase N-4 [Ralstonia sp.]MBA4238751.1 DNA methylase N-4 [Ralstonia sp.]
MAKLEIIYRAVSELRPRATNPRTHTKKQLEQVAASIRRFGFTNPVLIDEEAGIIAGHGRVEAAKLIGMTEVPTVRLANMSEADIRAYVIADNRLAENAGWDRELLGLELKYLSELDIDFDVTITGFDAPEIDVLIGELSLDGDGEDPADAVPEPAAGPAVTRPGDIWRIGPHRLICGDATSAKTYAALLGNEKAAVVFTDPPYNVPISGHVSGLGGVQHREFAMASGEMTSAQFTGFLTTVFGHLADFSVDGAIHFQCMDWRHIGEILAAGGSAYTELKNLCVWAKTNGGMGSLYRSAHELVFVFKSGTAPHVNNVELGKHGRYRTNVWTYAGANSFGTNRDAELAMHPTVKPVAMVADAILDCSRRKDIVLDAFAGSGTTLVAAHRTGRRGYGVEIDPTYCDVIIRRMRETCELDAVLDADGRSFDQVAAERLTECEGAAE